MIKQTLERKELPKATPDEGLTALFKVISALKTPAECARFFEDLCTRSELKDMAERWSVARRVANGEPYRKISVATGASTATVTRVARWLNYGAGGYRMVLERAKRK